MESPRIGDIVKYQCSGQEYEHAGTVVAVLRTYFIVTPIPCCAAMANISVLPCLDWWQIVGRNGKPYRQPDRAGSICPSQPILDSASEKRDADAPRMRKRFFESPRSGSPKTKKKGARR